MNFKPYLYCFVIFICCIGCRKQSPIQKELKCNPSLHSYSLKEYTDFNKNFKLKYPSSWKTKLYYDNFQSKITVADTTKQLKETYIFDASWNLGEIELSPSFALRMDQKVEKEQQVKVFNSGNSFVDGKPYYWHVSHGKSNKNDLNLFKAYVKTGVDSYLMIYIELYGESHIEERICEGIEILDSITFL